MTININQFDQQTVRGAVDLQISRSGVISGVVSPNQATALKAGDALKLDSAVTTGRTPNCVKAGTSDEALGFLVYDVQKSQPVAGDAIQVTFDGGPVTWQMAGGTIACGAAVESESDGDLITLASGSQRGIALDPAVNGQL